MFGNVQSIVNKMDEVRATMALESPDIMALTETWTHEGIGREFLNVEGFELLARSDRNDTEKGRGAGIVIYVKKTINAREIEEKTDFNQSASIEIKNGSENVILHVVYRSPNSSKKNDEDLCQWVGKMRGPNVIIGDFNLPDIDWHNDQAGSKGREFFEVTMEQFMEQLVTEPTHKSGNILDLVLCNREDMINDVKNECRIGKSDHDLIMFKMTIVKEKGKDQMSLNYGKAQFDEMRTATAEINWKEELMAKNVNEMWHSIKGHVLKLMNEFIPWKKRKNGKNPPWMDSDVKKCIREKKMAWKKWKETKKEKDREEYKKRVNVTKKKIRKKKNAHERKIAECRKTNPKLYYAFVNQAKKTRCRIGPLLDKEKRTITDPEQ